VGEEVGWRRPFVAASLPGAGERFQGQLPPIVEAPAFAIRKRAKITYTLEDYVEQGVLTPPQLEQIRQAVIDRKNILVAGGTGSGKTTFANAILAEEAFRRDRVIMIEATPELQCSADDCLRLLTRPSEPKVTMGDLMRMSLRLRPDRIVVGEVRGPEAYDMIKAWNTGHPGGVATVHANGLDQAVDRLGDLIQEAGVGGLSQKLMKVINFIAFLSRVNEQRAVSIG